MDFTFTELHCLLVTANKLNESNKNWELILNKPENFVSRIAFFTRHRNRDIQYLFR
jgi:hypothetical protein